MAEAAAAPGASAPTSGRASCSKSEIAPYVHAVRSAAANFIAYLGNAGAATSPMSRIAITLTNGERLTFTFTGKHFKVSGTALPAACRKIPQDDWTL